MGKQAKDVYDSPPSEPADHFWLSQGEKMVEGSLPAIREAAKALMTGLGALQGIYLAILGFGEVSKKMDWAVAPLMAAPLVVWMAALLFCLRVMMTSPYEIHLQSPESIQDNHRAVLRTRQADLWYAYAGLVFGLLLAVAVIACMPALLYSA